MVRTFSRADLQAADQAWLDGEFDPAWARFRDAAARRGFIYPPSGSRHDSWDESPGQRAILWRAIEETPELLARCIGRADSWHSVVEQLTRERDDWRRELAQRVDQGDPGPSRRQAPELLGNILRRLGS